MNWLEKLNSKYGRYGIRGITRYMLFAHLLGYVLMYVQIYTEMPILDYMLFSPADILHGQVWRLISWILIPSTGFSFWELLFVVCLLMLGDSLEHVIGSFRMTVYFIGGIIISDIGAMILFFTLGIPLANLTAYYMLFSLYLMLGLFMPEAEVRLYFVLPVKMKWLLLVYAVMFGYNIISAFSKGYIIGFLACSEMILALINLGIFVFSCKNRMSLRASAAQAARRRQYRSQVNQGFRQNRGTADPIRPAAHDSVHKCCICGRTDETNPELTFRYCSKCTGGKEYCNDHLFTHEHS